MQTEIVLLLPFQVDDFYLFFSYLIAWARTSTVLNRIGESEHAYLVPDLRGKAFSLSPLSMTFGMGFEALLQLVLIYLYNFPPTTNLGMPVAQLYNLNLVHKDPVV